MTPAIAGPGQRHAQVVHDLLLHLVHIGTLLIGFPDVTPTPPQEWPDDRFDVVWTFTETADG